ncbi:MAG TPA: hypothetical protein VJ990_10710 [Clostridia bacterium]|nr:hypothetical protein [Clostridia bacterium]
MIENYIIDEFGELMVEKIGNGYGVRPLNPVGGGGCDNCSSCG